MKTLLFLLLLCIVAVNADFPKSACPERSENVPKTRQEKIDEYCSKRILPKHEEFYCQMESSVPRTEILKKYEYKDRDRAERMRIYLEKLTVTEKMFRICKIFIGTCVLALAVLLIGYAFIQCFSWCAEHVPF